MPYHNVDANEGRRPRTAKDTQKVVHNENSRLNSGLMDGQRQRRVLEIDVVVLVAKRRENLFVGSQFSIKDGHFIGAEN